MGQSMSVLADVLTCSRCSFQSPQSATPYRSLLLQPAAKGESTRDQNYPLVTLFYNLLFSQEIINFSEILQFHFIVKRSKIIENKQHVFINRCAHCCQYARLSRSRPGFDPRSRQVSWMRFFRGFSSPVIQMSGSFRPPRSPNIIQPSLSSSIITHYGRQSPKMLICHTIN